ncbi:MAG TPA: hypothetical protein VK714_01900 [Myxococcota bacterium]|nr:hypothetical protein [Myxococcota bacterium]
MSDRSIEQLKLVLGAEGWKAFMAELVAARGRGRDVVVWRWLAMAETMRAEKVAEQRAEAEEKAKADAEESNAIAAIVEQYMRANPELTGGEVIPLLLRDGRPEDAEHVLAYCGRELPHSDGHNVKARPEGQFRNLTLRRAVISFVGYFLALCVGTILLSYGVWAEFALIGIVAAVVGAALLVIDDWRRRVRTHTQSADSQHGDTR